MPLTLWGIIIYVMRKYRQADYFVSELCLISFCDWRFCYYTSSWTYCNGTLCNANDLVTCQHFMHLISSLPLSFRTPMTWQSSRSRCSPARLSRCSTADREPSTTILPPSSNSNTFASPTPPPERVQPPLPPPYPQEPPPSAGTCPPAALRLKARLQIPAERPSWPVRACRSPARTWPATCVKLSVMPTSTRKRHLSTPCRSSPRRGAARWPGHWAPSAPLGWKRERRRVTNVWKSGGRASRSWKPSTSGPRAATSKELPGRVPAAWGE